MDLYIVLRSIELRIVDGFPIKDPVQPVRITSIANGKNLGFDKLLESMETRGFHEDLLRCKKDEGITTGYMNRCMVTDATEGHLERIEKVLNDCGIKFEIIEGSPALGGGGLFHQSIIFL